MITRRAQRLAVAILLGALPACTYGSLSAGYMVMELEGDLGIQAVSLGIPPMNVDLDQALGQDERVESPYGRIELGAAAGAVGLGVFASGFQYDHAGTGILTADLGNIVVGTPVASEIMLGNIKAGAYFDFNIGGTFHLRPGFAIDGFIPEMTITSLADPTLTETFEEPFAVPLPYLQVALDLGWLAGFVEAGYLPFDTRDYDISEEVDVESETFDVEAMLRFRPIPVLEAFVGYRLFRTKVKGVIDQDEVDVDWKLSGLVVGGSVYW